MDPYIQRLVDQVDELAEGQIVRNARIKALEDTLREIQRVVAIEDSGDVDPRHQYQQVKRVQEIVDAALRLPRQEVTNEETR